MNEIDVIFYQLGAYFNNARHAAESSNIFSHWAIQLTTCALESLANPKALQNTHSGKFRESNRAEMKKAPFPVLFYFNSGARTRNRTGTTFQSRDFTYRYGFRRRFRVCGLDFTFTISHAI
jgi:hypothetical protein